MRALPERPAPGEEPRRAPRQDPVADSTRHLVLRLQALSGNRAVARLLEDDTADTQERVRGRLGGGQPLDEAVRAGAEAALGLDLGEVRVHRDAAAAGLAGEVNARAFAVGSEVFFGAGAYDPDSRAGYATLIHELVHTTQRGPASNGPAISDPADADERMAASVAERVADGRAVDGRAVDGPAAGGGARQIRRSVAHLEAAAQRSLGDIGPGDAAHLVNELMAAPVNLAQFGPRRCLLHAMQEIAGGTRTVTRAELDRLSDRYAPLVLVRPDGYWVRALTGKPLQRAFPPERMASPPYEIGRFYYSNGGVMYLTDAALQAVGNPVAELGLEHDVLNAALDGVEDAVTAMARGLARLITHPIQTITDLVKLPGAVAKLIANSPEYWEQFKAKPLPDQVRAASELVSTLVLMYGTAAGTSSMIGAAGEIGDLTVNVLRLQGNGTFAVAQVAVPAGTMATAMAGGPGAVYILAMANNAAGGAGGSDSGGTGGGGGSSPPEFLKAVRELDATDAGAKLTDVQRAALEWNARAIADKTGLPLASGRYAWRSLFNQLSRPRWRFLNQAPEVGKILRDMLQKLPDGPYSPGDPTRSDLINQLAATSGMP